MDKEKPPINKDYQDLVNKVSRKIVPFSCGIYPDPLNEKKTTFDQLRSSREYSNDLVNDFVDKICNVEWLPPGAAMMLFVYMCTNHKSALQSFSEALRMKMMQIFNVWDESHPWVKANVLLRLRDRLYEDHHHKFCRAFVAKAREYDKIKEKENGDI